MLQETSEKELSPSGPDKEMAAAEEGGMDIAENGKRAAVLQHQEEGTVVEGGTAIDGEGRPHKKAKGGRKMQMPAVNMKMPEEASSLNVAFLGTLSGIIKLAMLALSLVCYICSLSSHANWWPGAHAIWTELAVWTSMVFNFLVLLLYVGFPHQLQDQRNVKGLLFVELSCSAVAAIIYLIAGCIMADWAAKLKYHRGGGPAAGAALACIVAFLLCALSVLGAIHYFTQWSGITLFKKKEKQQDPAPQV
jgi:hypothetical protein